MESTRKDFWTQAEDEILRDLYSTHRRTEIGQILGKTEASVRGRCSRLNLNSKGPAGWTPEEISLLTDFYDIEDGTPLLLGDLAASMGRTKSAVCQKAKELDLTNPKRKRVKVWKCKIPKYATKEELRIAIGTAMKQYIAKNGHPRGSLGMKHTPESLRKISEGSRAFNASLTPDQRQAIATKAIQTKLRKYGSGNPGMKNNPNAFSRCKGGKRADLEDRYFRSSWEANYARYLNFLLKVKAIKSWEYEPKTFIFEGVTRGAITYTPDFFVTEKNGDQSYHEVKGWMTSESKTKLARMAKHYPDVKIVLIDEPAYRAIARDMNRLPGWE